MNKYLKTKEGSIEDLAKQMQNKVLESDYQDKFKKELDKAGKPLGQMTGAEKKSFFNKIDKMHKGKNEAVDNPYAVGMAAAMKAKNDQPPLKKSTITKAHDIAKSIEKDQKEEESIKEVSYPHKMYSKDGKEVEAKTPEDHKKYAEMGYTHKNETHSFMTKDMNKSKKDAKGEKEIVDPAPKMKFKEAYKKAKKEAMNTVGDATADQANQRVGEGPKENDPDIKKPKAKADTGSKATP